MYVQERPFRSLFFARAEERSDKVASATVNREPPSLFLAEGTLWKGERSIKAMNNRECFKVKQTVSRA